jgi:hypothetical protein
MIDKRKIEPQPPNDGLGHVLITEGPHANHFGKVIAYYNSPEGYVLLTVELQDGSTTEIKQTKTRKAELKRKEPSQ